MPWVTAFVILWSLLAHVLSGTGTLAYHRGSPEALWQLTSASLSHYDLTHLTSNLAGFALLGGVFERAAGARALTGLLVATVSATMVTLHLALDHYVVFAGISAVNYAILGALTGRMAATAPVPAAVVVAVVIALQALTARELLPASVSGTRPTWELHLLAMALGLAGGGRLPGRSRKLGDP